MVKEATNNSFTSFCQPTGLIICVTPCVFVSYTSSVYGHPCHDKWFSTCCLWHDLSQSWLPIQESWYEKLNRWDEALEAYNRKYQETPIGSAANLEAALGRLRSAQLCLAPAWGCPALPCPALPCPALPCPALPCPALPLPCTVLSACKLSVCLQSLVPAF